ncbi:hypothetical protein VQH23_05675 [Pararoseomonas sp. SCSIO 73927]|uniref:hypothetical protein n=1 Tax=Pararoseomonas sp. SCSIO 73927 TaxID=3114537 RepID=UPI0030D2B900
MDAAFRALRETPLHRLTPAEWEAWYPRVAAYLDHPDPETRASAVERLMMGVFRAGRPPNAREDRAAADAHRRQRAAWLLDEAERAHAGHPDILPTLLRGLRWQGDDPPFPEVLLPWLRDLRARALPGVPDELAEGAEVLLGGRAWDGPGLPPGIDHPSDWVRGCIACALGRGGFGDPEGDGRLDPGIVAVLTEVELARPGIVGPFWSGCGYFGEDPGIDPLAWMLDIIERRRGPEPADLPFNGVDFHVHELAAGKPEAIRRLERAGRLDIAIEAAVELRGKVEGMAPLLRELAASLHPAVAHAARVHLALYHGERAPGGDPGRLRHRADWRPGADLFVVRWGDPAAWSSTAAIFPADRGAFGDDEAQALIDAALPPGLRGEPARHPLASAEDGTGALRLSDSEMRAYASGARVTLSGDPVARRWSRIEISGGRLGKRWRPLGDGEDG